MSNKSKAYTAWCNMRQRCYSPEFLKNNPSYVGCSICPEWEDFSVFEAWFDKNYVEGYHLDKDTKVKGDKVYSPDTCVFIPPSINCADPNLTGKTYTMEHKTYGIISFENQREFSREYELDNSCVSKVLRGDRKTHKGWCVHAAK